MKRLVLLVLLVPTPAYAWVIEYYKLDFRTSCSASGTTICVTADNFTDYFTFSSGPHWGSEPCYYDYTVAGLDNNTSLTSNGMLMTFKKENTTNPYYKSAGDSECGYKIETYTYTRPSLRSTRSMKYGQIDIKAKVATSDATGNPPSGLVSAIWSLGQNATGYYGEVDMIEQLGKYSDGRYYATHHYGSSYNNKNNSQKTRVLSDIFTQFHTYSLVLGGEKIAIYVDGVYISSYNRNKICNLKENGTAEATDCGTVQPFNQPFQLILSLWGGGSWAGTIDDAALPASMTIESITFYTLDPNVKNAGFPVTASPTDYLQ